MNADLAGCSLSPSLQQGDRREKLGARGHCLPGRTLGAGSHPLHHSAISRGSSGARMGQDVSVPLSDARMLGPLGH